MYFKTNKVLELGSDRTIFVVRGPCVDFIKLEGARMPPADFSVGQLRNALFGKCEKLASSQTIAAIAIMSLCFTWVAPEA